MAAGPAPDVNGPLVVGLGELIWDLFPEGRRLGGAPSNFAYVSRLLGTTRPSPAASGATRSGARRSES
jgi:fructokinase